MNLGPKNVYYAYLYENVGPGCYIIGVQLLSSGRSRECVAIGFNASRDGLYVEYTAVVNGNSPRRFGYVLPDTADHPVNNLLLQKFYPAMKELFKGGLPTAEDVRRLLTRSAT